MYTKKQIQEIYKHAKLPPWGYRKFGLNLTPTNISNGFKGLKAIPDDHYDPIFKHPKDDESEMDIDKKRKQRKNLKNIVPGKWLPATLDHLQLELDCIYPDLEICFVSALKSDGGGGQQGFHSDFGHHDFVRFAGLISFDDETKLEIKTSGKNGKISHTIKIQAGEAIVFRGDVFHAGSAYEKVNRRIYFKALPKGCSLKLDELDGVALGFVCDEAKGGCGEAFSFEKDLYNHCQNCAKWKNRSKKRKVHE